MREDPISAGILAFTFFVSCAACVALGLNTGETNLRKEAIRAGHAEWVADASGKPQFKWKECK
tara:strand:- start:523 stop:711 length:189 start_codon:yes stop_codon:yes gene_type:complete